MIIVFAICYLIYLQVYLPAIVGYVPRQMLHAISAFLDFCYLIRRPSITASNLLEIEDALQRFHHHRVIFKITGVRDDFSLPRQHSLHHYPWMIQLFGAPNGLCSSITESKHIKAVKEPWRRSNRFEAIGQMLLTNQRLDKLAAARVDFATQGLLAGPLPPLVLRVQSHLEEIEEEEEEEEEEEPQAQAPLDDDDDDDDDDEAPVEQQDVQPGVILAKRPSMCYFHLFN